MGEAGLSHASGASAMAWARRSPWPRAGRPKSSGSSKLACTGRQISEQTPISTAAFRSRAVCGERDADRQDGGAIIDKIGVAARLVARRKRPDHLVRADTGGAGKIELGGNAGFAGDAPVGLVVGGHIDFEADERRAIGGAHIVGDEPQPDAGRHVLPRGFGGEDGARKGDEDEGESGAHATAIAEPAPDGKAHQEFVNPG